MHNVSRKKILILGASGMLGNAVFRFFSADHRYATVGTLRSTGRRCHFTPNERNSLVFDVDMTSEDALVALFVDVKPDIVINCVGIIKQHGAARNPLKTLSINAVLPHRLRQYCRLANARLVHISTDCVFSGNGSDYTEFDFPDSNDLYGRTKYLGEVDYPHTVTLRTSIIGHELDSSQSLIDWFLNQKGTVNGYKNAIFSGLPTIEIARVIRDFVIPNENLAGVYHLSADPISKHDLLSLVADVYGKKIKIKPDNSVIIDRSLNSRRFRLATGYEPKPWPELILAMHQSYLQHNEHN